jgi:uncharacterized protein YceH (UPF0502 family)
MPPRLSTWKAKHKECQKAVDDVKAHYQTEVAKLETENAELRARLAALEAKISAITAG